MSILLLIVFFLFSNTKRLRKRLNWTTRMATHRRAQLPEKDWDYKEHFFSESNPAGSRECSCRGRWRGETQRRGQVRRGPPGRRMLSRAPVEWEWERAGTSWWWPRLPPTGWPCRRGARRGNWDQNKFGKDLSCDLKWFRNFWNIIVLCNNVLKNNSVKIITWYKRPGDRSSLPGWWK